MNMDSGENNTEEEGEVKVAGNRGRGEIRHGGGEQQRRRRRIR